MQARRSARLTVTIDYPSLCRCLLAQIANHESRYPASLTPNILSLNSTNRRHSVMLKCIGPLIPAEIRSAQSSAFHHFTALCMSKKIKSAQFLDNMSILGRHSRCLICCDNTNPETSGKQQVNVTRKKAQYRHISTLNAAAILTLPYARWWYAQ
jgi:hypothetical protein